MSLIFKKHVIFELKCHIILDIFHVIIYIINKNHVIFEPNIIIFHVIFSCHLQKLMT